MIRFLVNDDAQDMSILHAKSFYASWSEEDMLSHIKKDLCFGFSRPIHGFIIVSLVEDQSEIITIAVDPKKMRKGIASALLSVAETELKNNGTNILFLEVAEDNHPAINFYKKEGFEPIGRRPSYYRRATGRVAAITYRKYLAV